jgi:hypothetical protein
MRLHAPAFRSLATLLIALMGIALSARADIAPDTQIPIDARGVPEGARVSLQFDEPRYYLGENFLGHFIVENVGTKPFSISVGGDYRGAARATRFKVSAVDADGKPVVDPYPGDFNMGGLGVDRKSSRAKNSTIAFP